MKSLVQCVSVFYLILIFGIPTTLSFIPLLHISNLFIQTTWLMVSPLAFSVFYTLTAGLLSLPYQRSIKRGEFPRDLNHKIYASRRLYGICWSAVYYFKPLYFLCLNVFFLKKLLFRLFGYRGALNFTIYPDTWIRDLPLLIIGEDAYISNRVTLGTNIALLSGTTLVASIKIGRGALIGHWVGIALGSDIGEGAEIGVGCRIGVNTTIGKNSHIGPNTVISHLVKIGDNVQIGLSCIIGTNAVISSNIKIPQAIVIPAGAKITTQEQILALYKT